MTVPAVHAPEHSAPDETRPELRPAAMDALVVALWFVLAGLVGAVVWWQVTTLPKVTKVGDAASLEPAELLKQVGIDGWFFAIAAVGGLLSGLILLIWRWRDPLLMVVLVALGGAGASWLMIQLGRALGPPDEVTSLRGLKEGAQVPMQLELHAPGIACIWSVFAVLGAIVYIWILRKPDDAES